MYSDAPPFSLPRAAIVAGASFTRLRFRVRTPPTKSCCPAEQPPESTFFERLRILVSSSRHFLQVLSRSSARQITVLPTEVSEAEKARSGARSCRARKQTWASPVSRPDLGSQRVRLSAAKILVDASTSTALIGCRCSPGSSCMVLRRASMQVNLAGSSSFIGL